MKLRLASRISGLILVVNTLLPVIIALAAVGIYQVYVSPIVDAVGAVRASISKKYEITKDRVREAYQPIVELSGDVASLSLAVCQKPGAGNIIRIRQRLLTPDRISAHEGAPRFTRARFDPAARLVVLARFVPSAEIVHSARPGNRIKQKIPSIGPGTNPVDPLPGGIDRTPPLSGAISVPANLTSLAQEVANLKERLSGVTGNMCPAVAPQFEAAFFVFSSIFSLFDGIKEQLGDLDGFLAQRYADITRPISDLIDVLKIAAIALIVWLVIGYFSWVAGRLARGRDMLAGKQ